LPGAAQSREDAFSEELLLRPLPDGHLLAHFHFAASSRSGAPDAHARGFPRAVAELLASSGAAAFSLSLARGAWDADAWGAPPLAAPPGAALTARWGAPADAADAAATTIDPDAGWRALSHGLGGLLCASLGALAEQEHSASPHVALGGGSGGVGGAVRFGSVGREGVCTENLTPWLKGLPCGDAAGVAALLRSRTAVFGARHVALTLRASAGDSGSGANASATHTLTLVLRPEQFGEPALSLSGALGAELTGACAAAEHSALYVALPAQAEKATGAAAVQSFAFAAPPGATLLPGGAGEALWSYDLRRLRAPLDVQLAWQPRGAAGGADGGALQPLHAPPPAEAPPVGVARWVAPPGAARVSGGWRAAAHLTGRGDVRGGIVIELYRSDDDDSLADSAAAGAGRNITVTVLQLLPPWCRVWWRTLALRVDGVATPLLDALAAPPHVVPHAPGPGGARRMAAGLLDVALTLPASVRVVRISMSFDKMYGRLDDFPPDAQRGVDVPPARLGVTWHDAAAAAPQQRDASSCDAAASPLRCALASARSASADTHGAAADATQSSSYVMYTGGLLVTLSSPDASMPFNVIAFVCTALALLHTGVLGAATYRPRMRERAAAADAAVAAAIEAAGGAGGRLGRLRALLRRRRGPAASGEAVAAAAAAAAPPAGVEAPPAAEVPPAVEAEAQGAAGGRARVRRSTRGGTPAA
jgi:phosphatidylinositol glycan class T